MAKALIKGVLFGSLFGAALVFSLGTAHAGTTLYKDDCYQCRYKSFIGVPQDTCRSAYHEEWGHLKCLEDSFGIQSLCWLDGEPCFNIIVTPGGGGGGGSASCSPPVGGYCPVSCWTCSITPSFRPVQPVTENTESSHPERR